jgi:hypothetical protein
MIIVEIALQDSLKMMLVQYDDMIQTVPPDAANLTLHDGILPRTSRCSEHLFDTAWSKNSCGYY